MDVLAARRLAVAVLGRDLRRGVAGRDWRDPDGDSLPLRVFRGWGVACAGLSARRDVVAVSYRGARAPSPPKDSVLVLTDGGWVAADLVRRVRTREHLCPDGLDSATELWTLDRPISGPLMRVFERGTYHVAGGALRYRRGKGGRQPLTAEVFIESSALEGTGGRILLRLMSDRTPVGDGAWLADVSLWPSGVASSRREE